jgi:enediyne biosynthesis protein E4
LRVKTVGTRSNRDGIGAVVRIQLPGGTRSLQVKSGGSYCSQSELPLTFGLGSNNRVPTMDILWPSGTVDHFFNEAANQTLIAKEGMGK